MNAQSAMLALAITFGSFRLNAADVKIDEFRNEKRNYTFDKYGSEIRFFKSSDGQPQVGVDFKYQDKDSKTSCSTSIAEEHAIRAQGWFLYVESSHKIWIFDGLSDLTLFQHTRNGIHTANRTSSLRARSIPNIPAKLLEALPQDVQQQATALIGQRP
jgi:hypothetical protein